MEWTEYSRHVSDWETQRYLEFFWDANVRNRRTAGQEACAARSARRADGADAGRHDRARAGLGRARGLHRRRWRNRAQAAACTAARAPSTGRDLLERARRGVRAAARARVARQSRRADHARRDPDRIARLARATHAPEVHVLSVGQSIDLYKDVGAPADIAERYDFNAAAAARTSSAHTRMATESAVTPAHAHPFTAGQDFCLVHNGSLSNPHLVRSKLEPLGIEFETDNDTEAACRFFEWRMREGDDLDDGGAARLQRAGRLLHVSDGHRRRAAHRARCVRLQAGGGGRDRRLRGDRLGVPLARASARRLATRRCSSPSRRRFTRGEYDAGEACANSISPATACAS